MRKPKPEYYVVFIVARLRGPVGEFIDMMRYDSCCPATEHESSRIESAVLDGKAKWVVLRRFVPAGADPTPTVGRWASFNVECSEGVFTSYGLAREARDLVEAAGKAAAEAGAVKP